MNREERRAARICLECDEPAVMRYRCVAHAAAYKKHLAETNAFHARPLTLVRRSKPYTRKPRCRKKTSTTTSQA